MFRVSRGGVGEERRGEGRRGEERRGEERKGKERKGKEKKREGGDRDTPLGNPNHDRIPPGLQLPPQPLAAVLTVLPCCLEFCGGRGRGRRRKGNGQPTIFDLCRTKKKDRGL